MRTARPVISRSMLGLLIVVSLVAPVTVAAGGGLTESVIPYFSPGYRYQAVAPNDIPGFEAVAFDASAFADGAGIFGTSGGCAVDDALATPWPAGEDLLVRRTFSLPADDRELRIGLILVSDAEVFINGTAVTDGFVHGDDFCPLRDRVVISVPSTVLVRGGENLLAIRARAPASSDPDSSAPAYLDAELRLVEPPANDDLADASVVDPLPYSDTVGLDGATVELDEPLAGACAEPRNTAWYSFSPAHAGSFVFSAAGESAGAVNHYIDSGAGGLTFVDCRSNGVPKPFQAGPGETHLFQVSPGGGRSTTPITFALAVAPPVEPAFALAPQVIEALREIQFWDQTSDPANGQIVSWSWQFGDGATSIEQFATHRYLAAGDYAVTLDVATADGRTGRASKTLSVHPYTGDPLVASFALTPDPPFAGGQTQLFDSSSDPAGVPIVAWQWSFGDGDSATTQAPTHVWAEPGTYQVELAVTTEDGRSASTSRSLLVTGPPDPIAGFGWQPFDPSVIDTVQFFDTSWDPAGAGITAWAWDFGDGAGASVSFPTHRYRANGTFAVALTVTTVDGRTAQATQTVTVSTHDVAIKALNAPRAAASGQAKTVHVDLVTRRERERVEVTLFRSTASGDEFAGSTIVEVPVGKTTRVSFDVMFTTADALVGKVTFRATVRLLDARDAIPADNEAISPPTKVAR